MTRSKTATRPATSTTDIDQGSAYGALLADGWLRETRGYFDKMTADGRDALRDAAECQSPAELLAVQQAWLASRAAAIAEAGVRAWGVALESITSAAADPKAFRLPD